MQIAKFLKACIGVSVVALSLGFLFQYVKQATVFAAATRSFESETIKPSITPTPSTAQTQGAKNMKLGAFSISLNVKDLAVSKAFYENLGFKVLAGDMKKNYLIMKNENALIGLFHGMFKSNILTFNPGWDETGNNTAAFDDVRDIQKELKGKGIKLDTEVDEKTSGPAGFVLTDPDGNAILIDQHR
jgi:catechol 2,3-dioxygenase-like lactoylglutathione lyase family enzyme